MPVSASKDALCTLINTIPDKVPMHSGLAIYLVHVDPSEIIYE